MPIQQQTKLKPIELDAKGKVLGRLATEVAHYLQGKHLAEYAPHKDLAQEIIITNHKEIVVTGKKAQQKIYYKHSGYPGGLYERSYEEQFKRDSTQVVRRAVYGMLPSNRLRSLRMNRITFTN